MTKYYWEYGEQDQETRRKYNTGDILENAAECLDCGEYIRSNHVHSFVTCKCGNVSVDGGSWYAKRSFKEGARCVNKIVPYKDCDATEKIK